MKQIATAYALTALSLFLCSKVSVAQQQKPVAEYRATWDASQNRWKDTTKTFSMIYTPEYTVSSQADNYITTYSGFVPTSTEVYQSRFFWEPRMSYSKAQIDSLRENGMTTPVVLDEYDRSIKGRVAYTRSTWDGTAWKPWISSTSMTDSMGIMRSLVNRAKINGDLLVTDSTHVDVMQDIKGNVTNVRMWQWTMTEPTLKEIAEQRYTLNGDGSIGVAEFWDNSSGTLAPALRMHDFDWVVRNKDFDYVERMQGSELFYGGSGYRSAMVDLPSGNDWTEYYQAQQNFDEMGRVTSYTFDGLTRDTFAFDGGLLALTQRDDLTSGVWSTHQGTRTLYDRDANGALRSVITQRFDPNTSIYVNDKAYFYSNSTSRVEVTQTRSHVSLFPNPAEDEITIESEEQILGITISNSIGATVLESGSSHLDVSGLAPGTYTVMIRTTLGEESRKFVKSR